MIPLGSRNGKNKENNLGGELSGKYDILTV